MKLSEAGELGLLRELESRGLIEGTEHDAAELAGGLVVTQDALVEGVHFRLDWLSWRELGFRAAAVNISDLAASAARPEALLVTLGAAGETSRSRHVVELYEGLAEAGVPVRGGDTTRASEVVVGVTALGRVRARTGASRRATGRPDRRHRPARRRRRRVPARGATSVRRSASTRGSGSAASRPRCWTSRTALPSMPAISPAAPAAGS